MTKEEKYKKLIQSVKTCSYRNKCTGLSYCDKCNQINMWSYWQGGTEHLDADILLAGQDWGDFNDATQLSERFLPDNQNNPEEYCKFVFKNAGKLPTDPNLIKLFHSIGYDIQHDKKDLFFTNLVLCYRKNGYSGNFRQSWATNCHSYFKELTDIIQPKVILCLGKGTYEGVMKALGGIVENKPYNEIIERHTPSEAGGYKVFPLAHCGSLGTANRNKNKPKNDDKLFYQKQDWEAIKAYL